jgi:hypothetical protein
MCETLFLCVYKWEWLYVLCECVGVCMCVRMLCQMCLFVEKKGWSFCVILFDTCHAL